MEWLPSFLFHLLYILAEFVDFSSSVAESIIANTLLYPPSVTGSSTSSISQLPNIFFGGPVKNVSVYLSYNPTGNSPNVISLTNTSNGVSITFPLPPQALSNVSKVPVYGFPPYPPAPSYSAYGNPGYLANLAQQIPYIPGVPGQVPQINYVYGPAVYKPPAIYPSLDFVSSYQPQTQPYNPGSAYGNSGYQTSQQQYGPTYQAASSYQQQPSGTLYSTNNYQQPYPETYGSQSSYQHPYSATPPNYSGYQNQYPQTYSNASVFNYAASAPENRYPYVQPYPSYPSFYQNSTNVSTTLTNVSTTAVANVTLLKVTAPSSNSSLKNVTSVKITLAANDSGNASASNPPLSPKEAVLNVTNDGEDVSFSLPDADAAGGGFEDLLADNSSITWDDADNTTAEISAESNSTTPTLTTASTAQSFTTHVTTIPSTTKTATSVKLSSRLSARAITTPKLARALIISNVTNGTSSATGTTVLTTVLTTSSTSTTTTTSFTSAVSPTSAPTPTTPLASPITASNPTTVTSSPTTASTTRATTPITPTTQASATNATNLSIVTSTPTTATSVTTTPTTATTTTTLATTTTATSSYYQMLLPPLLPNIATSSTAVSSKTTPTLAGVPTPGTQTTRSALRRISRHSTETPSSFTEETTTELEQKTTQKRKKAHHKKKITTTSESPVEDESVDYDYDGPGLTVRRQFRTRQPPRNHHVKIDTSVDFSEDVFHASPDNTEEQSDLEEPTTLRHRRKQRKRRPTTSTEDPSFEDFDQTTDTPSTSRRTHMRTFAKKAKFVRSTTTTPGLIMESGFVNADGELRLDSETVTTETENSETPGPISSTKVTRPRGPVVLPTTTQMPLTTTEPTTTVTSTDTSTSTSSTTPATAASTTTTTTAISASSTTTASASTVNLRILSTVSQATTVSTLVPVMTAVTSLGPVPDLVTSTTTLRSTELPLPTVARGNTTIVPANDTSGFNETREASVASEGMGSTLPPVLFGSPVPSTTSKTENKPSTTTVTALNASGTGSGSTLTLPVSVDVTSTESSSAVTLPLTTSTLNSDSSVRPTDTATTASIVQSSDSTRDKDAPILLQDASVPQNATSSPTSLLPVTTVITPPTLESAYFGPIQLINEYNQPVVPGTIYRHVRPQDWGVQLL